MGKPRLKPKLGLDVAHSAVRQQYDALIDAIRFLGEVSARVYGLLDSAEIYRTVLDEFRKSDRYSCNILLLTNDREHLLLEGMSAPPGRLEAAEKAVGIRRENFLIDLAKSHTYSRVIQHGEIVATDAISIMKEIFPEALQGFVPIVAKILGFGKKLTVVLPIHAQGSVVGVMGITPPAMFNDFIPSARTFSRQISSALELAHANSARRMAEAALRESERKYRSIFENATEGIFQTTPEGGYLSLNPAIATILGYDSPEEMMLATQGSSASVYADPDDRKSIRALLERDGAVRGFEARMRRKDGSLIWVSLNVHVVNGSSGGASCFEGTLADISTRKRAEAEALESAQIYQALVETTETGYLILDTRGLVVDANAEYVRLSGHGALRDIAGRSVLEWTAPYDQARVRAALEDCLRSGKARDLEVDYMGAGGEVIPVEINATVVQTSRGARILSLCRDITKRRQTESKVRDQELRFRALIEHNSDAISLLDAEGRVLYDSPSYFRMMGYTEKDRLGRNTFELVHRDDRDGVRRILAGLLESPDPVLIPPVRIRRCDGSWIWIEGVASNLLFVRGVNALVINFRDITARRAAEAALRESEERYRLLHETAGVGIAYYSPDGRVVSYNRAAAENMGGKPEDFAGKLIFDLFPQKDAEFYFGRIKAACTTDGPMVYEDAVPLRSGARHFISTFSRILDAEEKVLGVQIVSQDVTAHRMAEARLQESEKKYRGLFSEMKSGCTLQQIIFDDAGNPVDYCTVDMNQAAEALLGLKKEDVIGKPVGSLLPPEEFRAWLSLFADVALNGTPAHYEQYSPANGKHFEGHAYSPVRGQFAVIFDDVTSRKKSEETLQNTQRLESLGVLAGGIAHDFNNLLGGIYGYIDIATETVTDPKITRYLSKAMDTIERSRGLTQQLLTFAKGGAPVRETARLFPLVQECALFALSGSNVSCSCTVPPDLWPCSFDRNQIGQVVDNIVINAKQAMPDGGQIEVSAANAPIAAGQHAVLGPGDYVRISIKDHGVGMPREILPRIFDPFYTTKSTGHGLGLATCYSIVKRHGGAIDVESEPGKGSTFHVLLPAAAGPVSSSGDRPTAGFRGSGTFLVMDDEAVMRDVLRAMLESLGYTVVCKENGREVIAFFSSELAGGRSVAGAILDLTVPGGMGGSDAIVELRKLTPETPIFVASGYAADPVMGNPVAHGFTASIGKPFRKAELLEVLGRHMRAA